MKTQARLCVVATGSRTIADYFAMTNALDFSEMKIQELAPRGARGANPLGERYAKKHGIPIRLLPVDWEWVGRSAGYRSHGRMPEYADALIASGAECKEAAHTIQIAERHGPAVYMDPRSAA